MRSGKIILYNTNGVKLSERYFDSRAKRKMILDNWEQLYGSLFKLMHYHILPKTHASDVDVSLIPKMKELRERGMPYSEIGYRVGICYRTVENYLKLPGVMPEQKRA